MWFRGLLYASLLQNQLLAIYGGREGREETDRQRQRERERREEKRREREREREERQI